MILLKILLHKHYIPSFLDNETDAQRVNVLLLENTLVLENNKSEVPLI